MYHIPPRNWENFTVGQLQNSSKFLGAVLFRYLWTNCGLQHGTINCLFQVMVVFIYWMDCTNDGSWSFSYIRRSCMYISVTLFCWISRCLLMCDRSSRMAVKVSCRKGLVSVEWHPVWLLKIINWWDSYLICLAISCVI